MREEEFLIFIRGKVVAIAQAVLDEEIGIIAGSRELSDYGAQMYVSLDGRIDEEYFTVLDEVADETMHLPVDWERRNWSEAALKRKVAEIAEYEASVKDKVRAACKSLIEKYEVAFPTDT